MLKWKFWQKKKHPVDILFDQGHHIVWSTLDSKGKDLSHEGCGWIDHHGEMIDITGNKEIKEYGSRR